MRAGPLSSPKVIELLNSYFVPVYVSNEDYRDEPAVSAAEKAERDRVFREARKAELSVGTVHVYILSPDGEPIDSLHVANAAKTATLVEKLQAAVDHLKTPPGSTVGRIRSQAVRPDVADGSLVLHLTARSQKPGGAWAEFPAENWLQLSSGDQQKLLPKDNVIGDTWEPDQKVAKKLLLHFYPATENNDVRKNEIEEQSLTARVISKQNGVSLARLDGHLRMRHDFYHKQDGRVVDAILTGYMEFDPEKRSITMFRLVTDQASYGSGTFGIALTTDE
jgi:hypothetical protein